MNIHKKQFQKYPYMDTFETIYIEASLHAKTMEAEDVTKEVTDILESSTKGMAALGRVC